MFSFTKTILLIFISIIFSSFLNSIILNVPDSFPTIQAGIDAAVNADTVLVQPGTYVENINFNGKNITVASIFLTTQDTIYISQTIIDGDSIDIVVKFENGEDPSTLLTGFTITNGNSPVDGGGIYCSNSSPNLENLIIIDNITYHHGGGIGCENSNPNLQNVRIIDNYAGYAGGGISCESSSSPSLQKVIIIGNNTGYAGGGISCENSNPNLENVTISDNSAGSYGGGVWSSGSSTSLVNSILWNDSPDEIYISSGSVIVTYSDIQGGWEGTGNIDSDPLFVDPENGDYHLTEDSPCIDAGDPNSPLDPDGTVTDMGAWFYNQGSVIEDNEIENVKFNLSNHPNPFNPETNIQFDIKENETGTLTIFNMKGQVVVSQHFNSGKHNYLWNAGNCSSGVYLYKLQTEKTIINKKMLLLK